MKPVIVDFLKDNTDIYREALKDVAVVCTSKREYIGEDVIGIIVDVNNCYNRNIFKKFPYLKFIASPTTGLTHIDIQECEERGISIISLKGKTEFLKDIYATAEHTFGLILAITREIPHAVNKVAQENIFNRKLHVGMELNGKTLGIVGYGRIGKQVKTIAEGFGMNVMTVDIMDNNYKERLCKVLSDSDVVTIHVDYNIRNKYMCNAWFFRRMKYGSYFINTSRGEVVNEDDLLLALRDNISGAALDVVQNENGIINKDLLATAEYYPERLIITPHIAGRTEESRIKTDTYLANLIRRYFDK
jgi:phosphoglycerate dehydrogenase-like enzyme